MPPLLVQLKPSESQQLTFLIADTSSFTLICITELDLEVSMGYLVQFRLIDIIFIYLIVHLSTCYKATIPITLLLGIQTNCY
ncbi:hypothetical protein L2E82_12862 [Cichorium intybus]|uniref:Uncharacterized protein n=1 Tax=Cichorium intybus TaxID=13427 RepID=A0ACB9GH94_CICIN|nr:hypothetical protein L2E82_12862 [Cichorium intybus]